MGNEHEKRLVAEAAADLVSSGMMLGLGTGSTVNYLLPALARRGLRLRCVASSPETEHRARKLGLQVEPFDRIDRLDLAIDGTDQFTPEGWLNKGKGGAHTREKILASSANRFVVIADSTKAVRALHGPVPVELLEFGLPATLRRLEPIRLRGIPRSPNGGLIADYDGAVSDAAFLADRLGREPGVLEHGLFPPWLVSEILVARGDSIEHLFIGASSHAA